MIVSQILLVYHYIGIHILNSLRNKNTTLYIWDMDIQKMQNVYVLLSFLIILIPSFDCRTFTSQINYIQTIPNKKIYGQMYA